MNGKTMPLSNAEIHQLVKTRPRKDQLEKAKRHESRLKFHTETILQKTDLGQPYSEFKEWIGQERPRLLSKGKVDRIDQLIRTPLPTVEISESIFSRLHRVFSSQDAFLNYEFTNPDLLADWEEYRNDSFWETKGFQAMQSSINSVWVVDLPTVQSDEYPQPINKLVDISNVIDIYVDDDNNCHWVIFRDGEYLYAYDSEFIRVYLYDEDLSGDPIFELEHGLGLTPARMMWNENLNGSSMTGVKDFINKESPITKELSDLDWLLFHMASKRYLDIANAYPMLVSYELGGDYRDDSITDNKQERQVPEGDSAIGPGTHFKVDIPEEGQPDLMTNPAKYINPPDASLRWHVEEEVRLIHKIFKSIVGTDQENRNDAAKNEMQIESAFESQTSVLMRVKKNFEIIHRFADSVICRLRYGKDFKGCTIDYGTRFFLKSEEDLIEDYKGAKEAGAGEVLLEDINSSILDTRFRDDHASRTRADMINDLDPLPNKTVKEAIEILNAGGINKINFVIKINLLNFVKRFERENLPLDKFGDTRDYSYRINIIYEQFKLYANESGLQSEG